MARIQRGTLMVSTLALVLLVTSACNRSASEAPVATFTPVQQSNAFATIDSGPVENIETLQAVTTGTALAQGSATPGGAITPQAETQTPTPLVVTNATPTATLAVSAANTTAPNVPTATTIPAGSRPTSYTLQQGEFPFCIARRFNIDPAELLALNGITDGDLYYAGMVLKIPQSGNPWPGSRVLNPHSPSQTHTVTAGQTTVYAVACYYGDVDPAAIAQASGISVGATLNVGQTLTIP